MITGLALMCLLEDPTVCAAKPSAIFYPTMEECYGDVGSAVAYAATLEAFLVDVECVEWGIPS